MQTFSSIINTNNPEEGLKKLDEAVRNASHYDGYRIKNQLGSMYCEEGFRKVLLISDTAIKLEGGYNEILLIRAVEFEE